MGNAILNISFQQFMQAFSWMLAHSIWQGIALAVCCGIVLLIFKRASAAARYQLILAHTLLFVLVCCITFVLELTSTPVRDAVFSTVQSNLVSRFIQSTINYITGNAPMILLVWFIVFLFRSVHLFGGMAYVYQARRKQLIAAGEYWNNRLTELSRQVGLKKLVQLFESGYVRVPMIIGHLKPVILIPAGLLSGLPAEQIEAVLLHELAHIRRNDFLVNLVQVALEAVFFFNPGLHYLSALLREEREHCCDDIALSHSQNKKGFVQALISFKEHALYGSNYAVAFPGKKNMLLRRISHILGTPQRKATPLDHTFFATGILFLALVLILLGARSNENTNLAQVSPVLVRQMASVKPVTPVKPPAKDNIKKKALPVRKSIVPVTGNAVEKPENTLDYPQDYPTYEDIKYPDEPLNKQQEAQKAYKKQLEQHNQLIAQARLDIEQSKRDQAQALLDLEQARKDLKQSAEDQKRAMADQQKAIKQLEEASSRNQKENLFYNHNIKTL